jgi:hypothetical protein
MGVRRVRIVGVFSVRAQWSITFAISSWVFLSNSVRIIAKRTLELHLIRYYLEAYLVKCRVLRNKLSPFWMRPFCIRPFFNVLGIVAFCTIATISRERETSTGPFIFITFSLPRLRRDGRTSFFPDRPERFRAGSYRRLVYQGTIVPTKSVERGF